MTEERKRGFLEPTYNADDDPLAKLLVTAALALAGLAVIGLIVYFALPLIKQGAL